MMTTSAVAVLVDTIKKTNPMQKQKTQPQSRLSNAILSLFNRLVYFIVLCGLITSAQAASGTQITTEAYHQSSGLFTRLGTV